MSDDRDLHQFDPSTVSRLFKLHDQPAAGGLTQPSEFGKTELLRVLLDASLPRDNAPLAENRERSGYSRGPLSHVPGQSLGQILRDPAAPLAELRWIKGYAKDLMSRARTEDEHEAAGVIYYAAIAWAIVYCDTRITQHSYKQVLDFFTSLLTREWISGELKNLFEKARDKCAQRGSKDPAS